MEAKRKTTSPIVSTGSQSIGCLIYSSSFYLYTTVVPVLLKSLSEVLGWKFQKLDIISTITERFNAITSNVVYKLIIVP